MTPADVSYATSWQNSHSFKLEFLYNGGASGPNAPGKPVKSGATHDACGELYSGSPVF